MRGAARRGAGAQWVLGAWQLGAANVRGLTTDQCMGGPGDAGQHEIKVNELPAAQFPKCHSDQQGPDRFTFGLSRTSSSGRTMLGFALQRDRHEARASRQLLPDSIVKGANSVSHPFPEICKRGFLLPAVTRSLTYTPSPQPLGHLKACEMNFGKT